MKAIIEGYLRQDEKFASNLRHGAAEVLAQTLERDYVERQGQIVKKSTNLAADIPELFKIHGRSLMKSRGQGRYFGKYRDGRNGEQMLDHERETRKEFEDWMKKRPERYIHGEPQRVLADRVAENYIAEADGNGGFVLARLYKGNVIDRIKPEDALARISGYVDPDRTELESLRQKAKWRDEAMRLRGFTVEEARGSKKGFLDETIKLLSSEYYRTSLKKRLPAANLEDLKRDCEKEYGHTQGLPVDQSQWTMVEKRQAKAYGEQAIEDHKASAWNEFDSYARERTPQFYKSSRETYSGLDYSQDNTVV